MSSGVTQGYISVDNSKLLCYNSCEKSGKRESLTMKRTFKTALKDSIPVMAGYIVLGTAFGVLLEDKGYSFIWAFIMSLTVYAGSMQFVAVNLLTSGASLISAAIMTLLVNARHLIYGISMIEKYRDTGKAKPYLIFSLTDETYALICRGNPENTDSKKYYLYISALNQCYWIAGSVIGALIGSAVTFNTAGIDFAMTALFTVIFVDQLLNSKNIFPAIIGIVCSVICLVIFKAQNFLIPSMLIITISLLIYGYFFEKAGGTNE